MTRSPYGWLLDTGNHHGIPMVVTGNNFVAVRRVKRLGTPPRRRPTHAVAVKIVGALLKRMHE
jgi:hypothetical protein